MSQGGIALPDRDYYTKTDAKSADLRVKYTDHVAKMFTLLGDDSAKATAEAKTVLDIETKLAEASMTRVERRDPDATYHRMSAEEIKALTPNFSWTAYFKELDAPPIAAVNVGQPKFFEALDKQLTAVPLADWKTYLRWHLVHSAAPSLSSKFVEENFNFYQKTLEGTKEMQPRWRRCTQSADRQLGFALGKLYVAENFPPEAKARADQMVKNLIAALREDLTTLAWMGAETRKAALAKLDAFTPKIGYPDKWRDYTAYKVERASYLTNVMNGGALRAPPRHGQDRQARGPHGVGHDAADGQRLLQRLAQRDRLPGRDPRSLPSSTRRRTTPSTTAGSARSSATR